MAGIEPILDPEALGESAQEDLRELTRALNGFRDPTVKEKGPLLQRVISRHSGLFQAVARSLILRPLSREERCFLRCGVFDPSLLDDELRATIDRIVDDEPDDSGVYYADEWLKAVASGVLSASTQDEAASGSYRKSNRPASVRRQEAQGNLAAQEDTYRTMVGRMDEIHTGIGDTLAELIAAFEQMRAVLPDNGRPHANYEELFGKLRQGRSGSVAKLLALAGKVSAQDRVLLNEYRNLMQARSALDAVGEADETEDGPVDTARLVGELEVVRQMMKMCVGPRGNAFPILMQEMLRGRPEDVMNTRQTIRAKLEHLEATDGGVFVRRFKGADRRIAPYLVIVPVYGARGICWEPWPRESKGMPGRIVVPLYSSAQPNVATVSAIASYRWLVAKEQAMHYWMEEGLTGQYYQLHMADKHFRHEPEFIKDYTLWVTEESQGRPRLDSATRSLFWRYVPFPKETREALAARGGMYRDLHEKDSRRASSRFSGMGADERCEGGERLGGATAPRWGGRASMVCFARSVVCLCVSALWGAVVIGCDRPVAAQPAPVGFEEGDLGGWQAAGEIAITEERAHEGRRCLRIDPGAEAALPLAPADGSGRVAFWVYDSGLRREGAAATEYAFGPMWGLTNTAGNRLVFGIVYAPFLDGNGSYAWVSTAQNQWFDRWDSQVRRAEGWHRWEFSVTASNEIRVTVDGAVEATGFQAGPSRFDKGFSGVFLRAAADLGEPLFVDDIEGEIAGPAPKTVLRQMPRLAGPLPTTHPVAPDPAWVHGPWHDPDVFPIGVWLQDPANAARYRQAGINLYIGLWQGPTEEQLAALRAAAMPVLCDQNETGLAHLDDDLIAGWLQGDEPDNAQPDGQGGYGPPVPPGEVVRRYEAIRRADPSRPVLLNLGQGLANEAWIGRGSEGKPEDYDGYVHGGDILSFDIYPATNSGLPGGGHELWYVAKGLDRLRALSGDAKPIWSVIECTRIDGGGPLPTPAEIRGEAWMSIIHGATGLIWFVHEFNPFAEAGLFLHPENLEAVTRVNGEIQGLARVLRSPTRSDLATAESANPEVPVDLLCKRHEGATYVFAVAMQGAETTARFRVEGLPPKATVEVLGEERTLTAEEGLFEDSFGPWGVRLYRIAER